MQSNLEYSYIVILEILDQIIFPVVTGSTPYKKHTLMQGTIYMFLDK